MAVHRARLNAVFGTTLRRAPAVNTLRAHGVANVGEAIDTNALRFDGLLAYGLPKVQN
jgi:hypothetical protein